MAVCSIYEPLRVHGQVEELFKYFELNKNEQEHIRNKSKEWS